jgi:amino acid adenylation domain-containing protein
MDIRASYHQERLWFIDTFEKENIYPSSPVYHNIPLLLEIGGDPDTGLLERAVRRVIQRHEALRTRIVTVGDQPVQRIEDHVNVDLIVRHIEAPAADPTAPAVEESKLPFSLESGDPLVRAILYRYGAGSCLLAVTFHHLIADRYSLSLFAREMMHCYSAYLKGEEPQLPPLENHYADFSLYQQEMPREVEEFLMFFWRGELSGDVKPLELPTDYPREAVHTFKEGRAPLNIPASLSPDLKDLSRSCGANLYKLLLAGFILLLHRYSGQSEIAVGASGANRNQPGTKTIFGPLANLLALRCPVQPGQPFNRFLTHISNIVDKAFEHQDMPFDELVRKLDPKKDMSRTALFDVLFQYEENMFDLPPAAGLTLNPVETNLGWGKYDLNLLLEGGEHGIRGVLVYNRDYYKESTVTRLAGHYIHLLESITQNAAGPVHGLIMLTPAEQRLLLEEWNRTAANYPGHKTIHQLFQDQVERAPDRAALSGPPLRGEHRSYRTNRTYISYKELDRRSGELARELREQGAGAGAITGIIMERTLEMVVAVMAILKAGGAYLPMDPSYPRERIDYMLKDSDAALLIDEEGAVNRTRESRDRPAAGPADAAYVIYTSGSTGKPKGVVVEHRSVVRLLFNDAFQFDFNEEDVWTLFHSISFDFSVWEMFGALLYGGRLVVVPKEVAGSPGDFALMLPEENVTVLNQIPGIFMRVSEEALRLSPVSGLHSSVRFVIFGGDALNPTGLRPWRRRYPNTRFINMYGITETTVHVTFKETGEKELDEGKSNIGLPIPTLRVYIVDNRLRLLPVGLTGEIVVAGDGVARGYLNRPELTAEKFIVHAFTTHHPPSTIHRLYLSGDLGMRLENGDIVYMGRKDNQVKVRGFRIELAEIENRLLNHPGVKEAVVVTRDDENHDRCLCAYTVPRGDGAAGLREFLAGELPDYMIPSFFVELEQLPLTPSGKTDRKALPEPGTFESGGASKETPVPRDDLEKKLAGLWTGVLALKIAANEVSIDDSFFEIGGHSLKAAVLIAQIHKELNVKIPLAEVFTHPTIRGLAQYIRVKENKPGPVDKKSADAFSAVNPAEKREYYPVTSAQKRLYIIYRMDPSITGYNMPFVFKLSGRFDLAAMEAAFQAVIQRHESFRTSFLMVDGQPVQRVHDHAAFEIGQIGPIGPIGPIKKAVRPFDLSQAPLLRVDVETLGEEEYLFMLDMHHIITDGGSHPILLDDVMAFYRGETLTPLDIQYKDYSQWHYRRIREGGEDSVLHRQEAYWREQFNDDIPVLNLPYDFPRPEVQSFEGKALGGMLEGQLFREIKSFAAARNMTLYMVLLGAFYVVLSRLSGQEDIIVGTPVAGRNHVDLRKIIGMFVNTLALRQGTRNDLSAGDFLEQVKTNALAAFDNQDFPFEELLEQVGVNRDMGRNPLFDVMFVLHNRPAKAASARPGREDSTRDLNVEPYPFEYGIAKFDLILVAEEFKNGLLMSWQYCSRLFEEDSIRRFSVYYERILAQIVKNPAVKLPEIELMSPEERTLLLEQFNDSRHDYPDQKTIHGLFEDRAEAGPDAVAVVAECPGQQETGASYLALTYKELNRKAGQLADYLLSRGVGAGDIAAVKTGRTVEIAICLLGILKAGAAYLPIDPEYPQERIDYMIEDSAARMVLLNSGVEETGITANNANTRDRVAGPHTAAYIIYTSGSTGRPKGVVVEHAGAVNTLYCRKEVYGLNARHISLQLFSYSFDGFITAFFTPLLCGAKGVLPGEEDIKDIDRLNRLIVNRCITHFISIPSFFRFIIQRLDPARAACLQAVTLAGEAVPADLPPLARRKNQHLSLWVEYGVTEAAVMSTIGPLTEGKNNPVGGPAWNTRIYVLDRYREPLPLGVAGELYIGGAGVARGYLNNPELTSERFVSTIHRLYRTGDLARWLPDGTLEFLGRLDHQVKIRGYRIETGEIEACLNRHERVTSSAVIAREDSPGQRYLCAYIAVGTGTAPSPARFKAYLADRLPGYMVPSKVVPLEELPLTPNGKLDRNALPDPAGTGTETDSGFVAPTNEMEQLVAGIWREVLNVDKVGLEDNFFHLGGNSLNIIQLSTRLSEALGRDIPVAKLYRYLTVKECARYLSGPARETSTPGDARQTGRTDSGHKDFAIIGMAGRFPGATGLAEFWDNLEKGIESISFLTGEALDTSGSNDRPAGYVPVWGGKMPDSDCFDAAFFGYSPKEAEVMNPQMRMFHQCAWESLEDAGYCGANNNSLIGLYAGASGSFYWEALSLLAGHEETVGFFEAAQLTNKDFLSTRISYKLDLRGPSFTVQTACSTSLVAVHLACRGIADGECDMALAGGVTIASQERRGYFYQEGMIQSPDGHCRAFDARAGGTVGGEGAGIVVLKPLEKALTDGDTIRAVIKGSAVNNDGILKAGYTAPSVEGQIRVINRALQTAGLEPADISYVETHGTGTILGDPIEIENQRGPPGQCRRYHRVDQNGAGAGE